MAYRPAQFDVIAFDADDTLWENEALFRATQDHFTTLLKDHAEPDQIHEHLMSVERRNLTIYGFGIKGFVLSLIETAIELTNGNVPPALIKEMLNAGQDMLEHPVELLPNVETTLQKLAPDFKLLLITKGDLLDQQRKISTSGLEPYFASTHIVSSKNQATYESIFAQHNVSANRVMMIGNSMSSDVIPPLEAGAWGTYVPHKLIWDIEKSPAPHASDRYNECSSICEIPALISKLQRSK